MERKDTSRRGGSLRAGDGKRLVTEEEALQRLKSMCAAAEHCRQDALDKMRSWGVDASCQERVAQSLVEGGYIDEDRYCRAFVNDKVRFDCWGRRKIEQRLRAKRIPDGLIEAVLDGVSDDEYIASLSPLLEKKSRSVKARDSRELGGKLVKYAAQRGYTMDIIRKCLNNADWADGLDYYD